MVAEYAVGHGPVEIGSGQTSVLLDVELIENAAGLTLSGVSADVIAPGNLGADSVAFAINPRDAASLPTTFSYDSSNFLGTFAGTIEHTGSVFFNSDSVEVGNFTIGFDGALVRSDIGRRPSSGGATLEGSEGG